MPTTGRQPHRSGGAGSGSPLEALPWSIWGRAFLRSALPQCLLDHEGCVAAANEALASACDTPASHLVGLPAGDLFDLDPPTERALVAVAAPDAAEAAEAGTQSLVTGSDAPPGGGRPLLVAAVESAGQPWLLVQLLPAAVTVDLRDKHPQGAAGDRPDHRQGDLAGTDRDGPAEHPADRSATSAIDTHADVAAATPAARSPVTATEGPAPAGDRASQQAAVARLGEQALEGQSLAELEQQAVRLIGELLGADRAAVVELVEPGTSSLRAAWGWTVDTGGSEVLRAALRAPSWLSAPVEAGAGVGRLLVAGADRTGAFSAGDADFLHAVANVLASASRHARSAEEAAHRSTHDGLTGLANRVAFLGRLAAALTALRSRRRTAVDGDEPGGVVGVLFVDVHDFAFLNASLGHDAADQVLRAVGRRIEQAAAGADLVARAGGDEYLLLITAEAVDDVMAAAERLLAAFEEPVATIAQTVPLSVCIGVAVATDGHERPDEVVRDADAALHRAKTDGSAEIRLFTPEVGELARTRVQTEHDLRAAVDRGELVLHYQPVIDLTTGEVGAAEALVRWHHPRRGLLTPAEFIHIAEETGQIATLGGFVLREACRQLNAWQERQLVAAGFRMSINVAPHQLARPEIVDLVREVLEEAGIAPSSLSLEITESSLLRGVERSLEHAALLKGIGVSLAIDDFGTGYSSLAQLRTLPFDTIKLDQSFVADLDAEGSTIDLVHGVIALARSLDLDVVAEGAERPSQVELLRSSGCRWGQGFVWCQPLPARQFEQWMRDYRQDPRGVAGAARAVT